MRLLQGEQCGKQKRRSLRIGDKIEAQAIAADLAKVGIRAKLVELEGGTFLEQFRGAQTARADAQLAAMVARVTHPGVALETLLSPRNYWSVATSPKVDAAFEELPVS